MEYVMRPGATMAFLPEKGVYFGSSEKALVIPGGRQLFEYLSDREEELREGLPVSELTSHFPQISAGALSGLMDRLLAAGLIRRRSFPDRDLRKGLSELIRSAPGLMAEIEDLVERPEYLLFRFVSDEIPVISGSADLVEAVGSEFARLGVRASRDDYVTEIREAIDSSGGLGCALCLVLRSTGAVSYVLSGASGAFLLSANRGSSTVGELTVLSRCVGEPVKGGSGAPMHAIPLRRSLPGMTVSSHVRQSVVGAGFEIFELRFEPPFLRRRDGRHEFGRTGDPDGKTVESEESRRSREWLKPFTSVGMTIVLVDLDEVDQLPTYFQAAETLSTARSRILAWSPRSLTDASKCAVLAACRDYAGSVGSRGSGRGVGVAGTSVDRRFIDAALRLSTLEEHSPVTLSESELDFSPVSATLVRELEQFLEFSVQLGKVTGVAVYVACVLTGGRTFTTYEADPQLAIVHSLVRLKAVNQLNRGGDIYRVEEVDTSFLERLDERDLGELVAGLRRKPLVGDMVEVSNRFVDAGQCVMGVTYRVGVR